MCVRARRNYEKEKTLWHEQVISSTLCTCSVRWGSLNACVYWIESTMKITNYSHLCVHCFPFIAVVSTRAFLHYHPAFARSFGIGRRDIECGRFQINFTLNMFRYTVIQLSISNWLTLANRHTWAENPFIAIRFAYFTTSAVHYMYIWIFRSYPSHAFACGKRNTKSYHKIH